MPTRRYAREQSIAYLIITRIIAKSGTTRAPSLKTRSYERLCRVITTPRRVKENRIHVKLWTATREADARELRKRERRFRLSAHAGKKNARKSASIAGFSRGNRSVEFHVAIWPLRRAFRDTNCRPLARFHRATRWTFPAEKKSALCESISGSPDRGYSVIRLNSNARSARGSRALSRIRAQKTECRSLCKLKQGCATLKE